MTVAVARRFRPAPTVGMMGHGGRGFSNPVDLALGLNGEYFVISRSNPTQGPMGGTRITVITMDHQFLGEIGSFGEGDGQFIWPTSIAIDSQGRIFACDEHRNDIQVWDKDRSYLGKWGELGSDEHQLNRPCGLAIDTDDNVVVVDHLNHKVKTFTPEGKLVRIWGEHGSGPGQIDLPWGICIAPDGNVYLADWGNDRIQKFTPNGTHLATFGTPGSEPGQLLRPSGVGVDRHGYVFVADWANHRMQIFTPDGEPVQAFRGDATMTPWAQEYIDGNPGIKAGRAVADLEPEKWFWAPITVEIDAEGRALVLDSCRHRIQVYVPDA